MFEALDMMQTIEFWAYLTAVTWFFIVPMVLGYLLAKVINKRTKKGAYKGPERRKKSNG